MNQPHDLDPLAQAQIEAEIVSRSRTLTEITEDVAESAKQQAATEVAYKLAYARAMIGLRSESGTVALKEAMALDACASEFEQMKMAEAVFKACQESGRNVRAQLDALRTLNANVRSVVSTSRGEGW